MLQDQLSTCTNIYVEEVLSEHFSGLLTFAKRAEAANKSRGDRSDGPPAPGFGAAEAGPVVRDFSTRWASAIEQLHRYSHRNLQCNENVGAAQATAQEVTDSPLGALPRIQVLVHVKKAVT